MNCPGLRLRVFHVFAHRKKICGASADYTHADGPQISGSYGITGDADSEDMNISERILLRTANRYHGGMRRIPLSGALVVLAMFLAACGSAQVQVDAAASTPATAPEASAIEDDVPATPAADAVAAEEDVAPATTTTTEPPPPPPPGRAALEDAVASGSPHVVWFWGAN